MVPVGGADGVEVGQGQRRVEDQSPEDGDDAHDRASGEPEPAAQGGSAAPPAPHAPARAWPQAGSTAMRPDRSRVPTRRWPAASHHAPSACLTGDVVGRSPLRRVDALPRTIQPHAPLPRGAKLGEAADMAHGDHDLPVQVLPHGRAMATTTATVPIGSNAGGTAQGFAHPQVRRPGRGWADRQTPRPEGDDVGRSRGGPVTAWTGDIATTRLWMSGIHQRSRFPNVPGTRAAAEAGLLCRAAPVLMAMGGPGLAGAPGGLRTIRRHTTRLSPRARYCLGAHGRCRSRPVRRSLACEGG